MKFSWQRRKVLHPKDASFIRETSFVFMFSHFQFLRTLSLSLSLTHTHSLSLFHLNIEHTHTLALSQSSLVLGSFLSEKSFNVGKRFAALLSWASFDLTRNRPKSSKNWLFLALLLLSFSSFSPLFQPMSTSSLYPSSFIFSFFCLFILPSFCLSSNYFSLFCFYSLLTLSSCTLCLSLLTILIQFLFNHPSNVILYICYPFELISSSRLFFSVSLSSLTLSSLSLYSISLYISSLSINLSVCFSYLSLSPSHSAFSSKPSHVLFSRGSLSIKASPSLFLSSIQFFLLMTSPAFGLFVSALRWLSPPSSNFPGSYFFQPRHWQFVFLLLWWPRIRLTLRKHVTTKRKDPIRLKNVINKKNFE